MAKKPVSKPEAAPTQVLRPTVVSFRITDDQTKTLTQLFEKDGVVGVRSTNQFARKIVADYLAGRLVYKNPKDKLTDNDLYPA